MMYRSWRSLLLLLSLWFACSCAAAQDQVLMGPYVTSVDGTSARILWVAPADTEAGPVAVTAGDGSAAHTSVTSPIPGRDEVLREVLLDGLVPGAAYSYRIGAGGQSVEGAFTTAAPERKPLRFVIYGDTRSEPDRHRAVAEAIAREDPAFVICTGDLVERGEDWERWKTEFFDPAAPYLRKATLWPVRGNHEGDAVFYRAVFGLPGNELYYSFDWGNAHFTVLDNYAGKDAMRRWLAEDLAASRAEWTFLCYHEPTFNVGGHGSRWGQDDFLPVLEEHEADFVVTGHSHLYERFLPIGPPGRKPIIHVVAGGGGAPSYAAEPGPVLVGGWGSSELHYCLFELDGDRCTMTVKRPDGSVLDEMTLVKRDGRYQDEVMARAVPTQFAREAALAFVGLEADLAAAPRPGEEVEALIVGPHLPNDAPLTVSRAGDDAPWQVTAQEAEPAGGGARVTLRAPDALTAGAGGLDPPLRLSLTLHDAGRAFTVPDAPIALTHTTTRRIVPVPVSVAVPHCVGGVVVDGDLGEWADVRPMPLPFMGRQDSSFRFCWSEDGLYGAVRARDAAIEANVQTPWTADTVELFVDKDFARPMRHSDTSAQYILSPALQAGPGRGHVMIAYGAHQGEEDAIACVWQPTPDGYALEFLVPARLLAPATMEPGAVVGINFALSDDGVPTEQFYSDKNNDGWRTPIGWGAVHLAE